MPTHPIESILEKTMQSIAGMVDVNTVIGDAVVAGDGTVIIPVSRVTFALVSGGAQYGARSAPEGELPFGGGGSSGASIHPLAFLVVSAGKVQLLPIQCESPLERLLQRLPEFLEALRSPEEPQA